MHAPVRTRPPGSVVLLVLALLLMFGGGYWAERVQTSNGEVEVRTVRFEAEDGRTMAAELYRPRTATADSPAPGVLAIHGYINDKRTQSPYATEYARRGYVVLALDQSGHGDSDPPAFAGGYGGPAGLSYLRSLPMVDPEQIVLEGHSMGGWAVLIAAGQAPDDYASVVISGASTGTLGAPEGTATFPRNLGLVYGRFDEFSELMWGAPTGATISQTDKLATLFDTDPPVEVGTTYGQIEEGTARWLAQPATTHPANHVTRVGVAPTLAWLQRTTTAPNPLPPNDQVWFQKEAGTTATLLGLFLSLFALSGLWMRLPSLAGLRRDPEPAAGADGLGWWIGALLLMAVPTVAYFWLHNQAAAWLPNSARFPQEITNGLVVWALGSGAVALLGWLVWFLMTGIRAGVGGAGLGGGLFRSVLLAVLSVGTAYLALWGVETLFGTDARFWVLGIDPLELWQAQVALPYLAAFAAFFLVLALVLHGQLRPEERTSMAAAVIGNGVLMAAGMAALLLIQYVPLLSGHPLPFGEPLLTIVAFQVVVLLPLAGMLSTYLFRLTGRVWAGAFTSALFVTWYIVASQATHVAS